MTPAERIDKAFDDAHVVIADYLEPAARTCVPTAKYPNLNVGTNGTRSS